MLKLVFCFACVFALLGITCGMGWATDFFSDDFESYVDDTELVGIGGWQPMEINTPAENANWTIMNPGGRGNPPTFDGTPSTGQFLVSDSDAAGGVDTPGSGMSHDIWSPPFSTIGASAVWLHMDCMLEMNNNGLCVFDVDVSTDDGQSWTNVFRRVAPSRAAPLVPTVSTTNADGYFGRLDIDLSAQAASKPNARFRLRQFEPNDDWWFAVDNVLVDDQPPKTGSVVIFCEGFGDGIPATWKVRSDAVPPNTGGTTWNSLDPCKRSIARSGKPFPCQEGRCVHRLDAGFAIMDSDCDPDPADDEYLITPVIDCSKATAVYLQYKEEIDPTQDVQEVLVSVDGGNTFETPPILSFGICPCFASFEDPYYAERIFEVPAAAGKSQVVFAWHYMSAGDAGWWAIDDVKVSVNGNYPVRTCCNREFAVGDFDRASGSISMSWKGLPGDQGFRVLVDGQQVGGDLPATARSFTDPNPPGGKQCVTYSLQSLVGGTSEFECAGRCVPVVSCPTGFACCVNQATKEVTLHWRKGVNVAGTGWRIVRNGTPLRTLPISADSFSDTVTESGEYEYQLVLNGGNAAQCPDLPLKCRAVVLGGDLIFFDDFDCYTDDSALTGAGWQIHEEGAPLENAAWTVTNPGGRDNPPVANGIPSQGKMLISDSDAACCADGQGSGRSHDVWSPPFNCTGKSTVWLHGACTLVLNNNGLVVFDLDVSTDDGATWQNYFRRVGAARSVDPLPKADIPEEIEGGPQVGNADGFFGSLDIDISAKAANKPNVRFRLRQFEPDDDWWMAVDNILIDSKPSVGGSRVVLPKEGFDGDIPANWRVDSLDGLAPWRGIDPCTVSLLHSSGGIFPDNADGRQIHHFDNFFALVYGDETCGPVMNDETLGTPPLDLTGTTKVFLHFKSDIVVTSALAEVLLSLDGGQTYDAASPIFSYQLGGGFYRNAGNAETAYNEYILEVPEAVNQKNVTFGFHYKRSGTEADYWGVDDVMVTAEGGGGKVFHRGDSDNNGQLQLTDAIRILGFLFLGGTAPTCLDAADADGNNQLQLTDAIRILGFLFLGGVPPVSPGPPPGACGEDNDDTHLGCETYDKC